ncbi:DUF6117 family protein [Mesorhizobium sp. 43Arga]
MSPDAQTGQPRYVVTAMGYENGEYLMTPFGHLTDGNPFEMYDRPEPEDSQPTPVSSLRAPGQNR